MIIPDINLLLYAYIDGFAQHRTARRWWLGLVNDDREIGLASPTLFGFLRISTNRQVLSDPVPVSAAVDYVRGWLSRPNIRFLPPGPRHVDIALDLLAGTGTAGSLTTDIQLAAHAIENGAEIHSSDTDFGRFGELRWVNPLR